MRKASVPAYIVFISRKFKRIRRIPNPAHPHYETTMREHRIRQRGYADRGGR